MAQSLLALIIAPSSCWRDSLVVLLWAIDGISGVAHADDSRSGLQVIAGRRPGLVLLDSNLPGDEAWWVLRQLKIGWPQLPCFVLAHTSEQEHQARAAGAREVLQAGFSSETFFRVIGNIRHEVD